MLAPRNAGARQTERRRTLLKRRADLLELVGAEADLPEELQLPNIRRMPMPDHAMGRYGVWALPLSHALHSTVEDVHEACNFVPAAMLEHVTVPKADTPMKACF